MKITSFILYSNLLIALAAGLLAAGFSELIESKFALINGLLIGFGTFFMYNIQRLINGLPNAEGLSNRHDWILRNKIMLRITLLVSFALILAFLYLDIVSLSAFITIGVAGIISYFYAAKVPFLNKPLRELPYLKIHLIVFVWILTCFVFPRFNQHDIQGVYLKLIPINYLYILAITIPFDMRDLKHDYPSQKTIPQRLGEKWARIYALILIVLFYALSVFFFEKLRENSLFAIAVALQYVLIQNSSNSRPDWYFSGAIDGGIILLGLAYMFA